jgi:hypothetical protein
MGDRLPEPIIVTSANLKRRWKVFVDLNRILTAQELFLDKVDGEWKALSSDRSPEEGGYLKTH